MKTNIHNIKGAIVAVVLAAIMTTPSLTMAQEDSTAGVTRERLIHKFDVDGNGMLNDREKIHARKFLARYQGNKDNPQRRDVPRRVQRPVNNR